MLVGLKSYTRQDKPESTKLKPRKHHQPCVPTWAARSRASFFPSGPQSPNLKQYHLTILFSGTHSASQNRTRGGETMECNVGVATASRLQSWQTTSYVVFVSPFFRHSGASETSGSKKLHNCLAARVRSLQERTNNRVLGGLRTTN